MASFSWLPLGAEKPPFGGFSISGARKLKTNIYVDGYNLYHGRLRYTPFKWLDLYKLFADHIVKIQSPSAEVVKIKYFTAPSLGKLSSHASLAPEAQHAYHRALEILYPNQIEIIKGYYHLDKAKLPIYKKPIDLTNRIDVWRAEEKQTDVNIALHAYRDACLGLCDQIVLVTNDTDVEPALEMIRLDRGDQIDIGVVIPIAPREHERSHRPPNSRLSNYANWTRRHILDDELAKSQLKNPIPTNKKPIIRPAHW